MAQKGHLPTNPPPYSASQVVYTSTGAYGQQPTTVYVGQPTVVVQQKPSRGLLGQLGHELNMLGNTVGREVDYCVTTINKSLSTCATGNVMNLFQTGNVVQLVSRASGHTLQIVMAPAGHLMVDGMGPEGIQAQNASWTIINEGMNQVRLHNNNNYLTIINGNTYVVNMPPGVMHGIETKFQMHQIGQFILFESLKERNRYVGVLPNGQLKSALACGREDHSHFGVRLLFSPYGAQAVPK
ncbi:hypothetical protein ACJMK2_027237 [Sinanodonta woodiana]|uniref:Uncharacterized protein n=1 Tax=Sinanodonta woodiana TaxID=1069815 RepID=A0ABD3XNP0_SINWO